MAGLVKGMTILVKHGMGISLERSKLSMTFRAAPPGRWGEIPQAALFWDRGGTKTLEVFRTVEDLHLLVMCLEGRADYLDERGVTATLLPGDVMLIPRGFAHTYRPTPGYGWSEIHVWMRGKLPDFWWKSGFLGPGLTKFQVAPAMDWARRLCRLCEGEISGTHAFSHDERLGQLQTWFANWRETSRRTEREAVPWLNQACRELEEGTVRDPNLERLARRLGISYESFRKTFTARAGLSPGQYRMAALIQKACRLLRGGNQGHKEIAEELGFADEFHFARTFRRHIGLPPGQYRLMANDVSVK